MEKNMQPVEQLMTVAEVAERLSCSRALVFSLIKNGLLGCYRIGLRKQGGVRVTEQQLQDYLKNREQPAGEPFTGLKHVKLA